MDLIIYMVCAIFYYRGGAIMDKGNVKKVSDGDNFRSTIMIIIAIIILLLMVVGASLAAIIYSKTGEKINRITTSTITMSYNEKINGINITNAYPITDEVGKKLSATNEYFDFTVSATTNNTAINYAICGSKESSSTLEDDAVKVYLTNTDNNKVLLQPTKISALDKTDNKISFAPSLQYILYKGTFNNSETVNYRLRMWIASDYNVTGTSKSYMLRVNVYGASGK